MKNKINLRWTNLVLVISFLFTFLCAEAQKSVFMRLTCSPIIDRDWNRPFAYIISNNSPFITIDSRSFETGLSGGITFSEKLSLSGGINLLRRHLRVSSSYTPVGSRIHNTLQIPVSIEYRKNLNPVVSLSSSFSLSIDRILTPTQTIQGSGGWTATGGDTIREHYKIKLVQLKNLVPALRAGVAVENFIEEVGIFRLGIYYHYQLGDNLRYTYDYFFQSNPASYTEIFRESNSFRASFFGISIGYQLSISRQSKEKNNNRTANEHSPS